MNGPPTFIPAVQAVKRGNVFARIWNRMFNRTASIEVEAAKKDLTDAYPYLLTFDQTSAYNRATKELGDFSHETMEMRRLYRAFLQSQPTAKAALVGKVAAVVSNELSFVPENPDDPTQKLEAEFCKKAWMAIEPGPALKLIDFAIALLTDGWAVSELHWAVGEKEDTLKDHWFVKELRSIDTNNIVPLCDQFRNILAFESWKDANRRYEPEAFMISQYLPMFESPTGTSDFRAAYVAIKARNDAIRLRMIFLTKYSGPFIQGEYTNAGLKNALYNELVEARAEKVIVTPMGTKINVVDLATTGTAEFKLAIEDFDKDIVISMHGSFLHMLEGNNGPDARGNSSIADKVSKGFQWLLAIYLETAIRNGFARPLMKYNFGENRPVPYAKFEAISPEEVLQNLQIDAMLLNQLQLPLSRKQLYRNTNRQEPEDPNDALQPPAQAAGGQMDASGKIKPPPVSGLPPIQFDEPGRGGAGAYSFPRRRVG